VPRTWRTFGTAQARITKITDTEITVSLPVHGPGTVDVTVYGNGPFESKTLNAGFTYLDPALTIPMVSPITMWGLAMALAVIALLAIRTR
jgi:hypothetical protein